MKPINHGQSRGRSIPGSGSCNPPAAPSGPAGRAGSTGGSPRPSVTARPSDSPGLREEVSEPQGRQHNSVIPLEPNRYRAGTWERLLDGMCKNCVFQAQNSNWSIVGQQERAGNTSLVGIQGFKLFGIWGSSNCSGSEAVWDPGSLSLFEVWEPQPVQDLGTFSLFRIFGIQRHPAHSGSVETPRFHHLPLWAGIPGPPSLAACGNKG